MARGCLSETVETIGSRSLVSLERLPAIVSEVRQAEGDDTSALRSIGKGHVQPQGATDRRKRPTGKSQRWRHEQASQRNTFCSGISRQKEIAGLSS